jgi:transposase-like protein
MMMGMANARSTATPARGAGAALRTYLRAFRGVHKPYLHLYVATYEAMVNTKRVTPELLRRMCIGNLAVHTGYT